jgi:hypothetical protein
MRLFPLLSRSAVLTTYATTGERNQEKFETSGEPNEAQHSKGRPASLHL